MSKTENPTPRRLKKARTEGDVPLSTLWLTCAGLALAFATLPSMLEACLSVWREQLIRAVRTQADPQSIFVDLAPSLAKDVLLLTAPLLLAVAAATILAGLTQTGGNVSFKPIGVDFGRLASGGGLRRIFAAEQLGRIARGMLAAASLIFALLMLLKQHALDVAASVGNVPGALLVAGELSYRLGWLATGGALLLGGWEFVAAYRSFIHRNRMSRAEVQAEAREAEADPDLRARRRQLEAVEVQRSRVN